MVVKNLTFGGKLSICNNICFISGRSVSRPCNVIPCPGSKHSGYLFENIPFTIFCKFIFYKLANIWGPWGNWDACSGPCGSGYRYR